MKTVNENNTKKEILAAYSEVLETLKSKDLALADPTKAVTSKKKNETLEKATDTVGLGIEDQIASLQKNVANILNNLATNFTDEIKTFNNLQDAIALKEAELQELFDIEKEAFTLTALINANKEVQDKFRIIFAEDKARAQAELEQLRADLKNEKSTHYAEINAYEEEIQKRRERSMEEYTYSFARKKQLDNDAWEDEKKTRERELSERENEVATKVSALEIREEKMSELESKVAEIPQLIDTAKKAGEAEGERKAGTSFAFEKRAIESKASSERAILENKVEMLEAQLNKANDELARLSADLKDAYAKIQETAKATVEAQANARMVSSFESIARENRTQK